MDGVHLSGNDGHGVQSVDSRSGKGGIRPLYDTTTMPDTFASVAAKAVKMTGVWFRGVFHFVYTNRVDVYPQRMLDTRHLLRPQRRRHVEVGKGLMVMGRTIRGIPLWEETNESKPQWTRSGRIETYRIEPEAIEYGETSSPTGRPGVYAVSAECHHVDESPMYGPTITGFRSRATMTIRRCGTSSCHGRKSNSIRTRCGKMLPFYCVTPKTRHRVHSQWSVNDWVQIYESNFGDPYRMDKRTPGSANTSCTSTASGERPRHQRRRLLLCGRQSGGPALSWLEAPDPFYRLRG